jgi:hypothetical protein
VLRSEAGARVQNALGKSCASGRSIRSRH